MFCKLVRINPDNPRNIQLENPSVFHYSNGQNFSVYYDIEKIQRSELTDKLSLLAKADEKLWKGLVYLDFDPVTGLLHFQGREIFSTSVTHTHIIRDSFSDC